MCYFATCYHVFVKTKPTTKQSKEQNKSFVPHSLSRHVMVVTRNTECPGHKTNNDSIKSDQHNSFCPRCVSFHRGEPTATYSDTVHRVGVFIEQKHTSALNDRGSNLPSNSSVDQDARSKQESTCCANQAQTHKRLSTLQRCTPTCVSSGRSTWMSALQGSAPSSVFSDPQTSPSMYTIRTYGPARLLHCAPYGGLANTPTVGPVDTFGASGPLEEPRAHTQEVPLTLTSGIPQRATTKNKHRSLICAQEQ